VIAALSTHIYGILLGRALQGAGAVSSAIMALVADLTQEVHRTKAMAVIGISIGLSFGVGMVLGPVISHWGGLATVFSATAVLTVFAILALVYAVPNPKRSTLHRDAEVVPSQMLDALKNPALLRLDYGIFVLHLVLMAIFVVLPTLLRDAGLAGERQWLVYLPVFVSSMAVAVPFIIVAEKKRKMKSVFVAAIAVLTVAVALLALAPVQHHLTAIIACLWLFFCGFNLLEATLPSLISKTAPSDLKGTAMGAYSSSQFFGLFLGGLVGGWINGEFGMSAVFACCALLLASWVLLSRSMQPPRYLANLLVSVAGLSETQALELVSKLRTVDGVAEVALHYDEAAAYLKVDHQKLARETLQDFLTEYANLTDVTQSP